jgi:hypothetical protein
MKIKKRRKKSTDKIKIKKRKKSIVNIKERKVNIKERKVKSQPEVEEIIYIDTFGTGLQPVYFTCGMCSHFYEKKKKKESKKCPIIGSRVKRNTDCCLKYKAANKIYCPVKENKVSQIACISQRESILKRDDDCSFCTAFNSDEIKVVKNGEKYHRVIEGKQFPCFASGYLKDYEDKKYLVSHGRFMHKATKEENIQARQAIMGKMKNCFPEKVIMTIEDEEDNGYLELAEYLIGEPPKEKIKIKKRRRKK